MNAQIIREILNVSTEIEEAATNIDKNVWGLKSGIAGLDDALFGFHGGELIVIAGRPSIGKSSLATGFARELSKTTKTLYFSLELSSKIMMERILIQEAGLNYHDIRKYGIGDKEKDLKLAAQRIKERQLWIDDAPALNPIEFQQLIKQHSIQCAIVDYVQLTSSGQYKENRTKEIDSICQELRATAKVFNIPVILLAQLNRQVEQRKEHRPMLCDLRDSGAIEQLAQVVILIHRPSFYEQRELGMDVEDDWYAELIIAKNYNGETGTVKCAFKPSSMTFIDGSEFE